MNKTLITMACALALSQGPAYAQHHGGGGGGGGFGGALLGGAVGGIVGGLLAQPRPQPPPPVYYAPPPPVVYQERVYIAPRPVYVPPAPHVTFHPWPGPGFACYEPEANAVNRAICGSEDLSAASLALVQAVYAAIQQTPYNAGAIRAEYASFQQSERASCSAYALSGQGDCVAGMLSHERDVMTGRLTGIYADEASRPVSIHLQLQQRLHTIGLLPGTPDGVYGDGTRRAIAAWQTGQGHPQTGVLSNEEVAFLIPGYGTPSPVPPSQSVIAQSRQAPMPLTQGVSASVAAVATPATSPVSASPAATAPVQAAPVPEPVTTVAITPAPAVTDPMNGVRENMPYALARPKLLAGGWQTQYFSAAAINDQDRELRQWFIDHKIAEVQDCSSSGCKMQFHNTDGRLLYVYTQPGSHASDAFRGAGPSVIAWCLDVDDITCPAPAAPVVPVTQQAVK